MDVRARIELSCALGQAAGLVNFLCEGESEKFRSIGKYFGACL